ncbi:hypothetical protein ACFKHW_37665 [Bradyrhizobium lupini]|uniref:hypothetical protein n=1 Tax=Rhizobium lupini TaxID=136996 RepID=UPI0036700775
MARIPVARHTALEITSATNAGMPQSFDLFVDYGGSQYKLGDRKNPGILYRYPGVNVDYSLIVVGHHIAHGSDHLSDERSTDPNQSVVTVYYNDSGGGDRDFDDLIVVVRKVDPNHAHAVAEEAYARAGQGMKEILELVQERDALKAEADAAKNAQKS